jgi:hypothetical protein
MNSILHGYLCRLKIISNLPTNGKFSITNNDLNIYYNSLSGWVWRKFNGDNKEQTTKYLIEFYSEIGAFSEQTMYNIKIEKNIIKRNKKMMMLVSLAEKIKESLYGIKNLINTYKGFLKTVSLLECLEQDIIIQLFNELKQFIPPYYHTEIIKMDLTFYLKKKDSAMYRPKTSNILNELCIFELKSIHGIKPTSKTQTHFVSDTSTPLHSTNVEESEGDVNLLNINKLQYKQQTNKPSETVNKTMHISQNICKHKDLINYDEESDTVGMYFNTSKSQYIKTYDKSTYSPLSHSTPPMPKPTKINNNKNL